MIKVMPKLICECKHLRKEHESGRDLLQDSSVTKCMAKDCPCGLYHPDYETRQAIWKIRFKSLFWGGMIIIGAIITGLIGNAMIDASVDSTINNYNITPKFHVLDKYQNGTLTNSTHTYLSDTPSELLKSSAWFPMVITLLIIGMFGSTFAYFSIFESEYRRMVRE